MPGTGRSRSGPGFLRRELAGVTDDWAAQARMNPAEAPMMAMRAAAAVHAVADNDDARVISADRIGDLVQATERKVLSVALGSLLDGSPDEVPALLADPDGPYRQAFPEDYLEDARTEAEVRVRAQAAENLARLERAIDEGAAGPLELKQAAREDWLDEGAQARMQERLETRAAEARSGRERILRVAGLVAGCGTLDSTNPEDQEAVDVYYERVVGPGLEALDPETRIGEAAGFAHRFGVLPKGARRQIRGGLAATEPAVRARAADAVVRLGEAAPWRWPGTRWPATRPQTRRIGSGASRKRTTGPRTGASWLSELMTLKIGSPGEGVSREYFRTFGPPSTGRPGPCSCARATSPSLRTSRSPTSGGRDCRRTGRRSEKPWNSVPAATITLSRPWSSI